MDIERRRKLMNEDPEQNRVFAGIMYDHYRDAIKIVSEEARASARWVQTSLLAINGGAAVATLGGQMSPEGKVFACAFFITGMLCALGAATASVRTIPARLHPIAEAVAYWMTVMADGQREPTLEGHEDRIDAANKKGGWLAEGLGWAAAALFAAGIVIAGNGVLQGKVVSQTAKQRPAIESPAPKPADAPPAAAAASSGSGE